MSFIITRSSMSNIIGAASGGSGNLTTLNLITTDGTNIPSNAPFELGIPLAPGALNSSSKLQILDAGSNIIPVQEDNRTTDSAGNVRFVKLTGVLPTGVAADNTAITLQSVTGTPSTSNPITLSNLLAQTISGDTFECKVTCTFPDGTVYTAKATDALNGSSTWTYGSPQNRGTFRQGPLCTEWICSAPLVTSGTPHAFLVAQFHITAYKASTSAWNNTTNPITGVKCIVILENGYTTISSPGDLVYDLLIQMGASTLSTAFQLNGSSPAATLTLGATSGATTGTLSTGTWGAADMTTPNNQDVGKAIVEIGGGGRGYINGLSSTTVAYVNISTDNTFGATSKTSGNWKKMGVYHFCHGRVDNYMFPAWWGTTQKVVAALPYDYTIASQMVLNYASNQTSAGSPSLTQVNRDGSHPMAMSYGDGQIKNFGINEAQTGDADHIGPMCYSFVSSLLNWKYSDGNHLNARKLAFHNGRVVQMKPFWVRENSTGGQLSISAAGVYHWSEVFGSTGIAITDNRNGSNWWQFALNHTGIASYFPYLMSGDFMWLEGLAQESNDYMCRITDYGIFKTTSVSISGSTVTLTAGYAEQTGEAVRLKINGYRPQIGGVNIPDGNIYYIRTATSTTVNLYDTLAHALAGGSTGLITFSSGGSNISFCNGYGRMGLPVGTHSAQVRQQAWCTRTLSQATAVWPDTIVTGLVSYEHTKTNLQRMFGNAGTFMKTTYADNSNYQAGGPRFLDEHDNGTGAGGVFATWQMNYLRLALCTAAENGSFAAVSDWSTFTDWVCADQMQWAVNTTDQVPVIMDFSYYVRNQTNAGVVKYTYQEVYQEAMKAPIGFIAYGKWSMTGQSASISSVSNQAAVTITLALNFFDTVNPSRHVGSWIVVGSGCGQITSVVDAKTCIVDATVTTWDNNSSGAANFSTGSGQTVILPLPSWGNGTTVAGTDFNYGSSNQDRGYMWLGKCGIEIAKQRGIDTSNYSAAVTFLTNKGLPSSPPSNAVVVADNQALKFNITHR